MSSGGRVSSGGSAGSGGFFYRVRRSVAVRLSVLYALMTIVGLGAIFGMLYWLLDGQLAQREHDELKSRLQEYATIVNTQTMAGLYMRLDRERGTLLEKLFFVRAVAPDLNMQFERVAAGWAEKDGENVAVPEGWDKWTAGQVFSWRTRRDRQEDLIVLSAALPNRVLLQVARAADSRAALLQPLRRTFMHMAPAVVILGFFIGWLVARRAVRPLQPTAISFSSSPSSAAASYFSRSRAVSGVYEICPKAGSLPRMPGI